MTRRLLLAAAVAGLAAPAPAAAQTSFRGVTDQGRAFTFGVLDDGRVATIETAYRIPCPGRPRFDLQRTAFLPPEEGGARRFVVGRGRFKVAGPGGRIGTVRLRLVGRRRGPAADPAAQRWSGTLRARMTVRRHGRREAPCSMRTRWSARAEGLGGGTWTFERPPEVPPIGPVTGPFSVRPSPAGGVFVTAETEEHSTLEASFRAPLLNRLEVGRSYEAGGAPGAAVGRVFDGEDECPYVSRFTVERLRRDRLRRIVAFTVVYERPCEDAAPERGRIAWEAVNP